jgi:hypothetical protein
MKRMNLRDVPEDVYAVLAQAAEQNRQSLTSSVVVRLSTVAQVISVTGYSAPYLPPRRTGVSLEDAVAAVREVREAS